MYNYMIKSKILPVESIELIRRSVTRNPGPLPLQPSEALNVVQNVYGCDDPHVLKVARELVGHPKCVPCEVIHPLQPLCLAEIGSAAQTSFLYHVQVMTD
jgi:hypothetical protein